MGFKVPELRNRPDKSALFEIRFTVIAYIFVVPSWAVTFTSIILFPIFNANGEEAALLLTVV